MAMNRVEVITSVERRRRWSDEEKVRLVAAMAEPGAVVTEIARASGVETSLLYRWRRQFAAEPQVAASCSHSCARDRKRRARASVSLIRAQCCVALRNHSTTSRVKIT